MILEFDDYRITTDERCFIVQKRRVTQASRMTKAENVGKVSWKDDKYYDNLDSALQYLGKSVLLDNDDVSVIKDKLSQLERKIEGFTKELKL